MTDQPQAPEAGLTDVEREAVLNARTHGGFRCDAHLIRAVERILAARAAQPDDGHLEPTPDNTPEAGMSWRDGIDAIDLLLNDCAQVGPDHQNFVRVSAVRDIAAAVRRYEDDTDESIRQALWEDAVVDGETWATGDDQ